MTLSKSLRRFLPALVLLSGIAVAAVLIATQPKPEQIKREETAALVETQPAVYSEQNFSISALGIVQAARDVVVQPQVGGIVTSVSEKLVPGGRLAENDVLFEIDPIDYRIAVDTRRTQLAEAQARLDLEKGRQEVARQEWALFADESTDNDDPALALRVPQLKAAEAVVAAARAQLRQAEVNLARTVVRAPFNAVVRGESVEVGQTLSQQSQAAHLAGTDQFRVQASIPVDMLAFINLRDGSTTTAEVVYDSGNATNRRKGKVVRILSDLDPNGQMARVLIEVDDPLSLAPDASDMPLFLDGYVDVEISTHHRARVVEIERDQLRSGDRVWIANDGVLDIRRVNIVWRREDSVLIDSGIEAGEEIVTSSLNAPVAGMRLRRIGRVDIASAGSAD